MSTEAHAIPDSIGPFIRALRRSGSPRVEQTRLAGDMMWSLFGTTPDAGSRAVSRPKGTRAAQDPTSALLAHVVQHERTPADQLFSSSGMSLEDFAKALNNLQETGLVKLVETLETPAAQLVEATPLGRQLARAR